MEDNKYSIWDLLPVEIQNDMLTFQELQGKPRNPNVFIKYGVKALAKDGGIYWKGINNCKDYFKLFDAIIAKINNIPQYITIGEGMNAKLAFHCGNMKDSHNIEYALYATKNSLSQANKEGRIMVYPRRINN